MSVVRTAAAGPNYVNADTDPVTGGISIYGQVVVPDLVAGDASAATANTTKIQAALSTGGRVLVSAPGTIYINSTLVIGSNTDLKIGKATTLRLTGGAKNMLINTNWNAPMKAVSSVTSSDGKTGTIQFAADPGFAVGTYIFLIGCVPDTYNGVWKVKTISTTSVANDTLTFSLASHLGTESPLITSPATINASYSSPTLFGTTTILASAADANISISGGSWYWDIVANTSSIYTSFGMYLRRIANLKIVDTFAESCRNPIVPANIYGGFYDNITCKNVGSLIQHSGSCRGIRIGTVRGDAWDDHTTFLLGDWPNLADITNGVYYGDMDEIRIDLIQSENAYRAFKAIGQANFKIGVISIGGIQGRLGLGAAAILSLQDDTGATTMAGVTGAAGGYIEDFTLERLTVRDAVDCHYIDIQNLTINYLHLPNLTAAMTNSTNCRAVSIASTATINNLDGGDWNFSAPSYYGSAYAFVQDATIGNFNVKNFTAKNVAYAYLQGANATNNSSINIGTLNTINCGQGVVIKKNGSFVNIGMAIRNGYQASPWLQLDGNAEVNIPCGQGLYASDAFGGSAASKAIHNCTGIALDVGGTGVVRQSNAVCVHIGTRGTLVTNNLVVCDATGAANSWHQMTVPTNVY